MKIKRRLKYFAWAISGYAGRRHSLNHEHRLSVLITYYSPARMKHINHQIRNILRCDFVEKLTISNHNPDLRIEQFVRIEDQRLLILNQPRRCGCGYRWSVANSLDFRYLVVIDDDLLLFPSQLGKLFSRLLELPEAPHGLAGMIHHDGDRIEYVEGKELQVDYLCEIYALTRKHLERYTCLRENLLRAGFPAELIDFSTDFVLLSHSGESNPRIHNAGRLFRCDTFKERETAIHQQDGFSVRVLQTASALRESLKAAVHD